MSNQGSRPYQLPLPGRRGGLQRRFITLVRGLVLRLARAACGCRALAVDGRLIAAGAGTIAVMGRLDAAESGPQPTQSVLRLGQLVALARRPMAGRFIETTLAQVLLSFAIVLQLFAFTRAALTLVGRGVPQVG